MSTAAKLKKKAAEYEQKKQFDKALQAYLQALEASAADEEGDADVALYNRVGDLFMRENNVAEAMKYYDRAVDLYSEGGFYNNAIALCNKILRLSPGRNSVYYKLGRISARKGFINDAKQNFLEYAHRMQTAGHLDEAFRALKEFADLVPDQEDVRLMLAEQLTKQGRTGEAVEQLQRLYEKFQAEGRGAEMRATVDRMKRIGAGDIAPSEPSGSAQHKTSELVFLDLGDSGSRPPAARSSSTVRGEPPTAPTESHSSGEPRTGELESTVREGGARDIPFLDVGVPVREATGRSEPPTGPSAAPPVTPPVPSRRTPGAAVPPIEPLGSQEFAKLRLPTPLDLPAITTSAHDLVIPGHLPSLDPGSTPPETAPAGRTRSAPLSLTPEMTVLIPDEPMPPRPRARAKWGSPLETPKPPEAAAAPEAAASEPVDWVARRKAAEAMFEAGDREGGLRELTAVMLGVEQGGDLVEARSVVEEILRIDPNSVPHHQKRVELAVRANDTAGLPDGYVALGDALFRDGQLDSARAIYRRVLELVPNDPRAVTALSTFGEAAAEAAPPPAAPPKAPPPEKPASALPATGRARRPAAAAAAAASPAPPANGAPAEGTDGGTRGSDFVNLGDWLRDESGPKSTRMVIPEHRPSGDEAKDFALMLHNFKAGVAQNVELDDSESHFDLGVAYKEMGLLDEAIAEFQRALQGPGRRVRTYEALGQCFLEKRQAAVASTILARALQETGTTEEQLVGVLYLLGYAAEAQHQSVDAVRYYQRVFAVDIEFRDVSRRLAALEQAAR